MIFDDAAPFPWLSWVLRNVAGRIHADPTMKDHGWQPGFGESDETYAARLADWYRGEAR